MEFCGASQACSFTKSLSAHKCFAHFQADKSAGKKKGQGQGAGKEGGDQARADEDNEAVESSKYGGVGWPKTAEEGDKDASTLNPKS